MTPEKRWQRRGQKAPVRTGRPKKLARARGLAEKRPNFVPYGGPVGKHVSPGCKPKAYRPAQPPPIMPTTWQLIERRWNHPLKSDHQNMEDALEHFQKHLDKRGTLKFVFGAGYVELALRTPTGLERLSRVEAGTWQMALAMAATPGAYIE